MTEIIKNRDIENRIFTIRGKPVMLDSDLSELYQVETRVLNQAVKRNIERFPKEFMFQLTKDEYEQIKSLKISEQGSSLTSQNVTLKSKRGKHRKYLPYAFTEHGVAMLSAVLKSDIAVKVSIQIIKAFVEMKKFLVQNAAIFQRLDRLELKQLETEEQVSHILKALEDKKIKQSQGIFFNGQIFDAYNFVSELIRSSKRSIILIDNYIDDTVLVLFAKRKKNVKVTIYTKKISKQLNLDLKKFNEQYEPIEIIEFSDSHDRFLIIDEKEIYHFGASLKDLGKKWFAFSKFDNTALEILNKLKLKG